MIEKEPRNEKFPGTLDIIFVNERWAQVVTRANQNIHIKYLDDTSIERINLSEYHLKEEINTSVSNYELDGKDKFPERELENIHYEAGINGKYFKRLVTIFGIYEKNDKN